MPWTDDLLKNLTPEQKRQLAESISRAGAWLSTLAGQVASQGRPSEVVPEKAPAERPLAGVAGRPTMMGQDLIAVRNSGLQLATIIHIEGLIRRAYTEGTDNLTDVDMVDIQYAIRLGNSMPVGATSDNPHYVTSVGNVKHNASIDIPATQTRASDLPHMVRIDMSVDEYHLVRNTNPAFQGNRALMMARDLGIPSTAAGVHYDAVSEEGFVIDNTFAPIDANGDVPLRERLVAREHSNA